MIADLVEGHAFLRRMRRIHLVGVGGMGMSGLAEVLLNLGYTVSGSDVALTDVTNRLSSLGVRIMEGHDSAHVQDVDVVVYSSAVAANNPELSSARARKLPVIPRAEVLAELMRMKFGVAVAGAHGKTTTSSLIAAALAEGGLDPTAVIGGRVNSLGSNVKLGTGDYLVAEADESDGSFLRLTPTVAVVTNLDTEHLDHYGTFGAIQEAFIQFINQIPFYGFSVLCSDDPAIREILPRVERKYVTYGLTGNPDYTACEISHEAEGTQFVAGQASRGRRGSKRLGAVQIQLSGLHNVANALAAVAVGTELEIGFPAIRRALKEFTGIQRRFEQLGEAKGIAVLDDYGHHPKEIQATLEAARSRWPEKRLFVLFQPHRYSRTRLLLSNFFDAFDAADRVAILPIYPAGETPIPGTDARQIHEGIQARGRTPADFVEDLTTAVDYLLQEATSGDVVLTLGAGDVGKVGPVFLKRLQEKHPVPSGRED